ncbi:MAG: lysostaphin resistance A-like protein [Halanaeroarchaeum sp.]
MSALVVTYLRGDSVRRWAGRIFDWRVNWRWWLLALGLPIVAAALITLGLTVVRGPVDLENVVTVSPALFVGTFLFAMVLSGGLNEEPGWRGFAQDHLNERYGALTASLIVGVVWAGWHLPYFVLPQTPHSSWGLVNQVGWFGGIVTLSILLAWLYNNTGSVLLTMVLHSMVNAADMVIPLATDQILVDGVINDQAVALVSGVHVLVYLGLAIVVVVYFGPRTLTGR